MLNSRTFRIFISSTFRDFTLERSRLQEDVFPRLDRLCRSHGYQFQPIDLRWGITERMGKAHETMKVCLEEIKRCQRITPRPNFVILLGDRYAWRPLPPAIPLEEFSILYGIADARVKSLLEANYWQDNNAVPPVFVLLPTEWSESLSELQQFFFNAEKHLPIPESQKVKYYGSATEQEIFQGALNDQIPRENVFAFFRHIDSFPDLCGDFRDVLPGIPGVSPESPDIEAANRLTALKAKLEEKLPGNVFFYTAALRPDTAGEGAHWSLSMSHLDQFAEDFYRALEKIILDEMEQEQNSLGDDDSNTQENFLEEKTRNFIGRGDVLDSFRQYLASDRNQPIAVIGAAGSGKTALIARCVKDIRERHPTAEILYRFIGLTANSTSLPYILERLGCDLTHFRAANGIGSSQLHEAFLERLSRASRENPLVIVLDALDQLGTAADAKNLSWLPSNLPPHVKIIVSTIATDITRAALDRKLPQDLIVPVAPLPVSDARELLFTWLHAHGRTLTDDQLKFVMEGFSSHGLPLYLKMVFERAKFWRSFSDVGEKPAPTVEKVIFQFLERLCHRFGPILVQTALRYLVSAKNGLSEDELLEVLFLDPDFRNWFDHEAWKDSQLPRGTKKIPISVWSGLYFDLEPFLVEKMADGISVFGFFHRLFYEVIRASYLPEEHARDVLHARLAAFFMNQVQEEVNGRRRYSQRTLSELPYHQTMARDYAGLRTSLGNFEFLQAKLNSAEPYGLQEDFTRFEDSLESLETGNSKSEDALFIEKMGKFIGKRYNFIGKTPDLILPFAVNEPDSSPVHQSALAHLQRVPGLQCLRYINKPQTTSCCLRTFTPPDEKHGTLRAFVLVPGNEELIGLFSPLLGFNYPHGLFHTATVEPRLESQEIVLVKWNSRTGRIIERQVVPSEQEIIAVNLDRQGKVISCAKSGERIVVKDLQAETIILNIPWKFRQIQVFTFTPDARRFAFGCIDGTLVVHDAQRTEQPEILHSFPYPVTCLNFEATGEFLFIGDGEGNLETWAVNAAAPKNTWLKCSAPLQTVSDIPERDCLVAGDTEGFLKFWFSGNRSEPFVLQGHEYAISGVHLQKGKYLYTADLEGVLKVWDLEEIRKLSDTRQKSISGGRGQFSPDSNLWAYWGEGELTLWSVVDGHRVAGHRHTAEKHACAFHPDGRLFFLLERTLFVLHPGRWEKPEPFCQHSHRISGISISRSGKSLLYWGSKTIQPVDCQTGEKGESISPGKKFDMAEVSPGGTYIVIKTSSTICLWKYSTDSSSSKPDFDFRNFSEHEDDFRFSPCEDAVFSWRKELKGVSLRDGEKKQSLKTGQLLSCHLVADHQAIQAVNTAGNVLEITWFPLCQAGSRTISPVPLVHAQYSPDGSRLATVDQENLLQVWDTRNWTSLGKYGVDGFFRRIIWEQNNRAFGLEGDDSGEFFLFELPYSSPNQ